jgi:tetratricopeptide (TPR) repeat protein
MKIRTIILSIIAIPLIGCTSDRQRIEAPKTTQTPRAVLSPVPKDASSPTSEATSFSIPGAESSAWPKPAGSYYYYMEAHLQQRKNNPEKAMEFLNRAMELDPESRFLKKESALLNIQQKNNKRALEIVEALVKEGDDVEMMLLYGRLKHAAKQTDAAKEIYEKVLAKDPKQENAYMILGSIYMDEKKYDRAYDIYRRLVEHFPASYIGHYFIGKIHSERGDLAAAEKAYKRTLELQPELEEPLIGLVEIYKSLGQAEKVIETYQELIGNNSDNIGAVLEFGLYRDALGDRDAAEKLLKPLGEESLSDPNIIQKIVQMYLNPKKYKEALTILNYMTGEGPGSSDLHYLLGVACSGLERDQEATVHFQKVEPGSRFYSNAVVHIAFAYQEQGDTNKAIGFLTEARKNLPEDPDVLLYLGSFYEEIEDFEKAAETLREGIQLDPKHVRLHFRLGVVNDKWGRKSESIEIMKKVIQLDPQNANALNYLGYTYADSGENLEEAERLIREALKYKPEDGYITDSLAWVYYKMGSYGKAVELLEKAVLLVPDDPIILEHLGDAYLKIDDRAKALESYRRSLLHKKKDKGEIEKKIETLTGRGI